MLAPPQQGLGALGSKAITGLATAAQWGISISDWQTYRRCCAQYVLDAAP